MGDLRTTNICIYYKNNKIYFQNILKKYAQNTLFWGLNLGSRGTFSFYIPLRSNKAVIGPKDSN